VLIVFCVLLISIFFSHRQVRRRARSILRRVQSVQPQRHALRGESLSVVGLDSAHPSSDAMKQRTWTGPSLHFGAIHADLLTYSMILFFSFSACLSSSSRPVQRRFRRPRFVLHRSDHAVLLIQTVVPASLPPQPRKPRGQYSRSRNRNKSERAQQGAANEQASGHRLSVLEPSFLCCVCVRPRT
jgi:hypothetical protein